MKNSRNFRQIDSNNQTSRGSSMEKSTRSLLPSKCILGKQRGISFWGIVWGGAFFVCAVVVLTKSIPPYMNNHKIGQALEALAEENDVMQASRTTLLNKMRRRLNIDYADTYVNLNKAFKVKQIKGARLLSVNYEVVIPMVSNASLLFDFKNEVSVRRNAGGN